jgi:hypothetical protein
MSLREQLRAHLPRKKLDVPALGGEIEVIGLTAGDMAIVWKAPEGAEGNAHFLARSLYKDGNRLVADGEEKDLLELPQKVFAELVREVRDLNFPSAEGNSAATTGGDSSSD